MKPFAPFTSAAIGLALFAISGVMTMTLAEESGVEKSSRPPSASVALELPGPCTWTTNTDESQAARVSYVDKATGLVFYVESDGRHVAAIDPMGKIRWVRDPFAEAKLCAYRVSRPTVVSIKAMPGDPSLLLLSYDSSQFGALKKLSGDFTPLGQN